ncbi:hypothetical protein SANTM175S_05053 [Streptomyces antimycoticus]
MLERFTGKTVIVFGAGSAGQGWGNGKAAAVAYAREGATVIAVDLRKQAAIETRRGDRRRRGPGRGVGSRYHF